MTERVFLHGQLCDPILFEIVSGVALEARAATLNDRNTATEIGGMIVDLDASAVQRLEFFLTDNAYEQRTVTTPDGPQSARIYHGTVARQGAHGAIDRLAAEEFMRLMETHSPQAAARALPQIRMRAASRLRAGTDSSPTSLTPVTDIDAVRTDSTSQPYTDYFAVREDILAFPKFDGSQSPPVKRASFLGGDAVTVLPYDPRSQQVLFVRQFRHGPFARGDTNPWTLEPAAGRIDPGEAPEDTARRELREETGITAKTLHFIGRYYPSPGAYSEYLYSYVAIADFTGQDGKVGGLEDEAEDIMSHVLLLDDALAMIETGEVNTGPLILSLNWLALNQQEF